MKNLLKIYWNNLLDKIDPKIGYIVWDMHFRKHVFYSFKQLEEYTKKAAMPNSSYWYRDIETFTVKRNSLLSKKEQLIKDILK